MFTILFRGLHVNKYDKSHDSENRNAHAEVSAMPQYIVLFHHKFNLFIFEKSRIVSKKVKLSTFVVKHKTIYGICLPVR